MDPDLDDLRRLHRAVLRQDPYDGDACLGAGLLASYLTGALPAADADAVRHHLDTCEACARRVAEAQGAMRTFEQRQADILERVVGVLRTDAPAVAPTRVPLADLAVRANDAVRKLVLAALEALADALGGPQPALATVRPGYRDAPAGTVEAKVVAAGEGRPDRLAFEVIAAHIDRDGRCVVDLSTADPNLPRVLAEPSVVRIGLRAGEVVLELPEVDLPASGRVTAIARLPVAVEPFRIPADHIEIHIVRSDG